MKNKAVTANILRLAQNWHLAPVTEIFMDLIIARQRLAEHQINHI
jgi:hypothetical protein